MTIDEKLELNDVDVDDEDIIVFRDYEYADAAIGLTTTNQVVYDYDAMIDCLIKEGMSEEEAADWVSYNTIRALDYIPESEGHKPIVMYRFYEN